MLWQAVERKPDATYTAASCPLQALHCDHSWSQHVLCEERYWRRPAIFDNAPAQADILVSRWVDSSNSRRYEETMSGSDRHIVGVALKTTRLRFTRGPHTIFTG